MCGMFRGEKGNTLKRRFNNFTLQGFHFLPLAEAVSFSFLCRSGLEFCFCLEFFLFEDERCGFLWI